MTTPFAAARSVAALAGGQPQHDDQQALQKDGVAAVVAPEFAPKRVRHADWRASPRYGRGVVSRLASAPGLLRRHEEKEDHMT